MPCSWLIETSVARAPAAGGAQSCNACTVGVKFVKLDVPSSVADLTDGDLWGLEFEELLIRVPATCFPCNTGPRAALDCKSVTLRSACSEEVPGIVACAEVCSAFFRG